jgi:Mrp family chromosome partitioning ATPase/capsular polysaccharide biosynthesis protein
MIDRRSEVAAYGGSTLRHYLRTIWRRKLVALAPIVVIPLAVFLSAHRQPAKWEASASVYVNRQSVAATSLIGQTPALDDPGRVMITQARLARVSSVAERALAEAGIEGKPARELLNRSDVNPFADTLIFTVREPDPALAARLATAYAHQFVLYRRRLDTAGFATTLAELERELESLEASDRTSSALYARLSGQQQQLESLRALSSSNVSLVQPADPGDAVKTQPRPLRDTALAGVASIFVALIAVFLAEALSTRARSVEEIETLLGTRYLGRAPHGRDATGTASTFALDEADAKVSDAFQAVRVGFELANTNIHAKTIVVAGIRASAATGSVAAGLAVALARAGRHVVLVDLDLREQRLTRAFGFADRPGLTSLAAGGGDAATVGIPVELGDAAATGPADSSGNGREPRPALLEVVPTGPLPGHPSHLLGTPALGGVLANLARRADVVLVNVPPLLETPDAGGVSALADGLLLVVDRRDARRPVLGDAAREIEGWPAVKLGFVLAEDQGTRSFTAPPRRPRGQVEPVGERERVR